MLGANPIKWIVPQAWWLIATQLNLFLANILSYSMRAISHAIREHQSILQHVTLDILARRPAHHGREHAQRVVLLAQTLADKPTPTLQICALAHDIGDSKFPDDTPEWLDRLRMVDPHALKFIQDVSERVSFSREQTLGRADWLPTLGDGVHIRNIVSDADKLDSLGVNGYKRLQEYNREKLNARMNPQHPAYEHTLACMISDVIWNRQVKLSAYMHTPLARTRAPELFHAMVQQHKAFMSAT